MPRTLIAMSGGVDSSVAAALLLEQGHACVGAYLKLCAGKEAEEADARSAAEALGIPFHVFDYSEQFRRHVIAPFVDSYLRGVTPNPCVVCNHSVKFAAMLDCAGAIHCAGALGCEAIATGHYVRREFRQGRWLLRKAPDQSRDQSYVLCMLTQTQLARSMFPLGELTKPEVRAIAARRGLLTARKRGSQDICFLPEGDYASFLERYTGEPLVPGDFVSPDGEVLGRHRGTPRYTLGQRKGLGLALPNPGYVCGIDPLNNTVTVGGEALLYSRTLTARNINLIACESITEPLRCHVKVRYRQPEQPAIAELIGEDTLRVTFDEPQRAITPGQAVVLYDGDDVVAGGIIAG